MGRRVIAFFLRGGGGVVRCRGVIKEISPDFRSPEVGISEDVYILCDVQLNGFKFLHRRSWIGYNI